MDPVLAMGQILGGGGFVGLGLTLLWKHEDMVAWLEHNGLPGNPNLMRITAVINVICGLMLVFNFEAGIALLFLFVFIASTALLDTSSWRPETAADRANKRLHFWKNVMIVGMLLMIYSLVSQNLLWDPFDL